MTVEFINIFNNMVDCSAPSQSKPVFDLSTPVRVCERGPLGHSVSSEPRQRTHDPDLHLCFSRSEAPSGRRDHSRKQEHLGVLQVQWGALYQAMKVSLARLASDRRPIAALYAGALSITNRPRSNLSRVTVRHGSSSPSRVAGPRPSPAA